jgi:hypothetical protein
MGVYCRVFNHASSRCSHPVDLGCPRAGHAGVFVGGAQTQGLDGFHEYVSISNTVAFHHFEITKIMQRKTGKNH